MKTYLEPIEIKQMEDSASNLRDRLLIRVLFHLGCRITEVLSLTIEDIDFHKNTVSIQHLKVKSQLSCISCGANLGRSHIFCPRCGLRVDEAIEKELRNRRQRTLPIDDETIVMLKEYIERGGSVTRNGKRLLFGINRHRAWQIIKECAEKAGLPMLVNPETGKTHNVSPHRLRDAFAVHAVKANDSGDGLRLLQEHLGHQSFNTTAKYRKVAGDEHRDWYNKLWKGGKK